MMSEHQERQEARKKDFEIIKVHYTHLKQAIVNDETLEQVKVALEKFKTSKKVKKAGLRFNPSIQRWFNVAKGRIARWERDNPPEPEPESEPETEKPDETPKKEASELSPDEKDTTSADEDEETTESTDEVGDETAETDAESESKKDPTPE